jgi:hypothetical protein
MNVGPSTSTDTELLDDALDPIENIESKFRYVWTADEPDDWSFWPFKWQGTVISIGVIATITTATLVGLTLCSNSEACTSHAWNEAVWGPPQRNVTSWCEYHNNGRVLMAEPANSVSNLGFMAVGMMIIACGLADAVREGSCTPILKLSLNTKPRRNHISCYPIFSVVLGLFCINMGVASFMMHAYTSRITYELDSRGMLYIVAVMNGYAILRFVSADATPKLVIQARAITMSASAIAVILISVLITTEPFVQNIIAGMATFQVIAIAVLTLVKLAMPCFRGSPEYLTDVRALWNRKAMMFSLSATITFAVALVCQRTDSTKLSCNPNTFIQRHAIWHALAALTILLVYLFIRAEYIGYPRGPVDTRISRSGTVDTQDLCARQVEDPNLLDSSSDHTRLSGADAV